MQQKQHKVAEGIIPVVASSDDNYAYPLGIMFISLLENTKNPERFHLFIIDGGISDKKKNSLQKEVVKRSSQLTFLTINDEVYANFPTRAHISAPAYYRISIPELFHESVTRAIYLDCDLIIKNDLQKLWDIDLEGHAIAAAENISSSTYTASGLKQPDYFNSGVMIIDLDKWRENNIPNKVRNFKTEHPELICTNDQCALNGVFKGRWKRLPLNWNFQSGLYRSSSQTKRIIKDDDSKNPIWSPFIIHYIGWSKPWLTPCYHPLASEYDRYRIMSSFTEEATSPTDAKKKKLFSLAKKQFRKYIWKRKYLARGYDLYQE
jgi:lipopolysaccharide biosynthesis glycosyltransferase